jgi:hypothetical protein
VNVEIGTEVAQFPEKEYINGIFLAVHWDNKQKKSWILPVICYKSRQEIHVEALLREYGVTGSRIFSLFGLFLDDSRYVRD